MQTAKVRLRKPSRVFTFLCKEDVALTRGLPCIVRSERGLEYGACVVPPEPCSDELARRIEMQVVRVATAGDAATLDQIVQEEIRAKAVCADKIREKNLPMKLIDAEYTFDKRKVVFYFIADQRVDFRELVRDLAQVLKTRIELRHIQVRDQAKMVGGFGECGRQLCCRTWLSEFMPISMKMAKRQNLSLNPEKISGQCGRLMCCLSYENTSYDAKKKPAAACPMAEPEPEEEAPEEPEFEIPEPPGREVLPDEEPVEDETGDDTGPDTDDAARPGESPADSDQRKARRRRRRKKGSRGGSGPSPNNG
ncbi:MAG: hypothetical protein QG656_1505 [Candidatus Hydrogenedentes bacterium]|nr:hypothetical protein [Candidatus Hydrogenedentota bacterium]